MREPAFAMREKIENLVALQTDTLGRQDSLTAAELDQYGSRSETIAGLYGQWDAIDRENFHYLRLKASRRLKRTSCRCSSWLSGDL